MKKTFVLVITFIALTVMPAMASVQNIKVSGDIDSTWIVRDQFDLGVQTASPDYYQNLLFTQTRLRVDADLTDNVSATVGLLNERVWGTDTETRGGNDIDLNLAFVELREMLYSPLTVIIGRQNFAFGNSLAIDSAGSNNLSDTGGIDSVAEDFTKRTAQDSVRMIFDYNPLTIDLVASKIASNNSAGTGAQDDDVDLFGVNTNYELGDDLDTVIEAYFWAKIDQSVKDTAGDKADTVYMPGVRVGTNPVKGLNLSTEFAWQGGNKTDTDLISTTLDNVPRNAWAGQVISTYLLPLESTAEYNPVLIGAYTVLTGDSNPNETSGIAGGDMRDTFTAWDPMFENQSSGKIYNSLFDYSNAHIVTMQLNVNPIEDVTTWIGWDGLWAFQRISDSLATGSCAGTLCQLVRQPDGSLIAPVATDNKSIGNEVGIGVDYDYTEDVRFGGSMRWFIPGNAFGTENNETAFQSVLHGSVNF